jgi:hypothetical protein
MRTFSCIHIFTMMTKWANEKVSHTETDEIKMTPEPNRGVG